MREALHCVSRKVPTFKVCVTLSNLNRFSKYLHCGKAHEICYKTYTTLPTLPYVPMEIKNSNLLQIFSSYGRKCKRTAFLSPVIFIACNFVIGLQILIVLVSQIASFTHIDCKRNCSCHCSFTCLLLQSICNTGNSSQQTSLKC